MKCQACGVDIPDGQELCADCGKAYKEYVQEMERSWVAEMERNALWDEEMRKDVFGEK